MVKLEAFEVEKWMDDHETWATYNIAETCSASISLSELQSLSTRTTSPLLDPHEILDYGAIRGLPALRQNLAKLYSARASSPLSEENVLITPGAIAANHLVFYSLVGPGDHVVCHYPTYQQLYSVPASLGAEVDLWKTRAEDGWKPSIEELKGLLKPNTKMIVINNPQNPTGAVLLKPMLEEIVSIAKERNILIMSDEVYRPLFHSISPMDATFPPSILNLGYANTIATGSLSKAYALAGIRVGWIASRNRELIEQFATARDYTTISVSKLDSAVAAFALDADTVHSLLHRNITLARENLGILKGWIEAHKSICQWVVPVAGTTAFVRFVKEGKPIDDVEFCERLQKSVGTMFVPGSRCFGKEFSGYVRIGYVPRTDVLRGGLEALDRFLEEHWKDVPLAS